MSVYMSPPGQAQREPSYYHKVLNSETIATIYQHGGFTGIRSVFEAEKAVFREAHGQLEEMPPTVHAYILA